MVKLEHNEGPASGAAGVGTRQPSRSKTAKPAMNRRALVAPVALLSCVMASGCGTPFDDVAARVVRSDFDDPIIAHAGGSADALASMREAAIVRARRDGAPGAREGVSNSPIAPAETPSAPSAPTTGSDATPPETTPSEGTPSETHPPSAPSPDVVSAPRRASSLGYNMDYPGDWTNAPPFIDLMKNARALKGDCASDDPGCDPAARLDLDAQGWVKSLRYKDDPSRSYSGVHAVLNTSNHRPDIGETFVVTWDGRGTVDVFNGGSIVRSPAGQRLTFRLQRDVTMLLLKDIDPADHVRNVRVFRESHEPLLAAGEVFNPELREYLSPFGSIRFMDWMESNSEGRCSGGSEHGSSCYAVTDESCGGGGVCVMPGRWDERPTPDQASLQASSQYLDTNHPERGTKRGGYPVETMVALANRIGADPHFNMPVDYTDEYVSRFAEYVRDHLGPGLTASVEYSNEVWNWGFPQAQYANTLGRALWPDEGSAWVQYAAGRTDNLCRLWKQAFAGQEDRVRCLISPQTGWRELAETVLECPAWVASNLDQGPCYQHVDAINITGYFSGCLQDNADVVRSWLAQGHAAALDRAFEQLEHGSQISGCRDSLDDAIEAYGFFKRLADERGLDVYVYESGTHFSYYEDEAVRQFLVDMTNDERMYRAYRRNFEGFRAAGGSIFNVWGWIEPNDAWANSASLFDTAHPKYRAILDFAGSTR